MREICFILTEERILRAYVGTPARVPDSRERWEIIWEHRSEITEIVHTHPGGLLDFSREDLTTMEAVEAGTGCEFAWSIVTRDGYRRRRGIYGANEHPSEQPWWMTILRELSFNQSNPQGDALESIARTLEMKGGEKPHEQIRTH